MGRMKLAPTQRPAYIPRNFGHCPGSRGVRPVVFTTDSQAMVIQMPALTLLMMPAEEGEGLEGQAGTRGCDRGKMGVHFAGKDTC